MGDMADWATDNGAMDDFYEDEDGEDRICNYCGATGLWWEETPKGWRLFERVGSDDFRMHICKRGAR